MSLFTSQGSLRLAQSSSTLIQVRPHSFRHGSSLTRVQDLSEVIKPHVRADYPATAEQPVAISESLLLRSLEFPELGSTALANKVAAMKRAYEYANIIFEGTSLVLSRPLIAHSVPHSAAQSQWPAQLAPARGSTALCSP